jgi:hypothetical protein
MPHLGKPAQPVFHVPGAGNPTVLEGVELMDRKGKLATGWGNPEPFCDVTSVMTAGTAALSGPPITSMI